MFGFDIFSSGFKIVCILIQIIVFIGFLTFASKELTNDCLQTQKIQINK